MTTFEVRFTKTEDTFKMHRELVQVQFAEYFHSDDDLARMLIKELNTQHDTKVLLYTWNKV